MNTNKYAMVIDGNYFLSRSLYALPSKGEKLLDDGYDVLLRKCLTDLCYQIKTFKEIVDTIVFTIDSHSWRKDHYQDYKANRKKNEDAVNWDNWALCCDEIAKILENHGIVVARKMDLEGDDLIYEWTTRFTRAGKSSIIISADRDLTQLLYSNETSRVVLYAPSNKKLYATSGFKKWLDTVDEVTKRETIFEINFPKGLRSKLVFNELLKDIEYVETNPEEVRFIKIISGDTSDNIEPIVYELQTSGRHKTSNEKVAKRVFDKLVEKNKDYNFMFLFEDDAVNEIVGYVIDECKLDNSKFASIKNSFNENVKLIVLNRQAYPTEIYEKLSSYIDTFDIENMSLKTNAVAKLINMQDLISGTKYEKTIKNASITSNTFKGATDGDKTLSFIRKTKR